jgi:class 3 adenylate cyclase/tetratricopeptide (TPR) repeat protein
MALAHCPSCGSEVGLGARFCADCGHSLVSRVEVQERRQVTALFADLVASTSMSELLDPEVVRGYVGQFFERASGEVRLRGGSVEKFSGDAALALFGLTQAHEDDPERAVRAALAIREGLAEVAPDAKERHGLELQVRIGIESGEVVAGDPFGGATMATGDPLNLSARLEQRAAPGEIVVGPRVHEATDRVIRYEPAGEWELAGKREPVPAWRVVRAIGGIAALGGVRGIEGLSAPLTGRDEELALLLDTATRVGAERKTVLFTVLGVPGVGKSRLVQEATDRLAGDGWQVLRGRCLPYGDGITYWPIGEIVRAAAGIGAELGADAALERLRASVRDRDAVERLAFVMGLASSPPVTGEAIDAEIAWAFRQLAEQLAGAQPTILVFEDIHWAEPPLLSLVEHLATWVRESPLLLVCLARPELLDLRPTWGSGRMEAARISLEPLSREEMATLIAGLLRIEGLPDALRGRVLDTAEGNPLFAEETIRMLIDRGQITRRNGHWVAAAAVGDLVLPESIEALIRARLDGVPREERAALQCAAVVGRSFSADAVARLAGVAVTERLDDAVLRDLLAPEASAARSYQFRHILIRDVAYASLPKARRAELHARVVDWLADWAGDRAEEFVEIEGYHREQAVRLARELRGRADPSQVAAAVAALERCARKAAAADDWRSMIGWAERALALDPQPAERHAELDALLLDGLLSTDAYERAGQVGSHLLAEAEAIGRRDLHGCALHAIALDQWLSLGRAHGLEGPAKLLAEARTDLEGSGDLPHFAMVIQALGDVHWWLGELDAAADRYEEAAQIFHEGGDRGAEVRVLLRRYSSLWFAQHGTRGTERAAVLSALESLAAGTSRVTKARVWQLRGVDQYWTGADTVNGETLVRQALAVFSEVGSPSYEDGSLETLANMLANEGELRAAIALHERQLEIVQGIGNVGRIPEAACWLSMTHLELGELAEAERYAKMARAVVMPDDVNAVAFGQLALGRIRDRQHRDAEAEQLLTDALSGWQRARFLTPANYHAALAEFHLRRGHWTEGERQARLARQMVVEPFGRRCPALPAIRRQLAVARAEGRRLAGPAGGSGRSSARSS